jgi:Tol biopolymer transport system component
LTRTGKIRSIRLPQGLSGPAWSSKDEFAFVSDGAVETTRADGASRRILPINFLARGSWTVTGLNWSPDGTRLLLDAVNDDGKCGEGNVPSCPTDIFMASARGGDARRLTHSGSASEAIWSPAGDQIAYHDGTVNRLLNLTTKRTRSVTQVAAGGMGVVDWQAHP